MDDRRECVLRLVSQPMDVNHGGKVHGGTVMKWMDQAAYACAAGWCGGYAVTASVGGMRFLAPIRIGDLVELRARIVLTGRTSMHVAVEVESIDVRSHARTTTTRCVMVFVAVDPEGKPTPVPAWVPATDADRAEAAYAERLKAELAGR